MSLPPSLKGRFTILGTLGRGAFGDVLRVTRPGADQEFALKIFPVQGDGERQRREIETSLTLVHPHVIRCHEGAVLGPFAYLLMELAEGSLGDTLEAPHWLPENWQHLVDACRGVAALHRCGLVHRDIKPENVLLTEEGAKISDFGLVRISQRQRITQEGMILGSLHYLSPEQSRGEDAGFASDVYSLGVLFYVVLEGRLPYPAELSTAELLGRIARGETRPFRKTRERVQPRALTRIQDMLHPDPARRPPDLEELAEELDRSFVASLVSSGTGSERASLSTDRLRASRPGSTTRIRRRSGLYPGVARRGLVSLALATLLALLVYALQAR